MSSLAHHKLVTTQWNTQRHYAFKARPVLTSGSLALWVMSKSAGIINGTVGAFIQRQRDLLKAEREAVIEQATLLLSKSSPSLLQQQGLALLNLGVVNTSIGLGGQTLVTLERLAAYSSSPTLPPHTFRPGDLAGVQEHTSADKTLQNNSGVVFKVSETGITVAFDTDRTGVKELNLPTRCTLVKLANLAPFDRMDSAVTRLEELTSKPDPTGLPFVIPSFDNSRLIQVLLNLRQPSPPTPIADLQFLDPNLNHSQQAAVRFALEATEVACIHGPPGTGKTHTLVEIVRQLVAQEKSVLVCAASNLAVDNLLERLVPHHIPLTRIGHPARVMETLHISTLDAQTARSEQYALTKDVKTEIEATMNKLTGKLKGKLKPAERRKLWEDVKDLRKEFRRREKTVVSSVLKEARVVLATCHVAGNRQLRGLDFDVAIIDEATQAIEAISWVPILKSAKLVLAGDPCQLPPTVIALPQQTKDLIAQRSSSDSPASSEVPSSDGESGESDAESFDNNSEPEPLLVEPEGKATPKPGSLPVSGSLSFTLFERLQRMYGSRVIRMLVVQYRMHAQIAAFPSRALYHRALINHESVRAHRLRDLPNTSAGEEHEEVLDVPVVFFDTAGCEYFERLAGDTDGGGVMDEGSKYNENEAVVVQRWVEKLVSAGVYPSQIAIITPYQAQVSLISSFLHPTMPELEIGSVDGMQGREKEAVILSLVRSNDKREVGFLKDKRRLNVAMTRARRHLCIVGDSSTIQHGSKYLKKWMRWLENNAEVRYAGPE